MDIKIIVLIIIIFIILYWELTNVKKELIDNNEKVIPFIKTQYAEMIQHIENNNDEICLKIKQYIDECSKNIKNFNTENINQLKKINILNQQPIKKIFNNFTDQDDILRSDENESNIDENMDDTNIQVSTRKNETICYLSDEITCHSRKNMMDKNITKNEQHDIDLTNNTGQQNHQQNHQQIQQNQQNSELNMLFNHIEKNDNNYNESPILYPVKIEEKLFPICEKIDNITCSITMISNIPPDVIAEFKYNPIVDKSISSELDMCDKCEMSSKSSNISKTSSDNKNTILNHTISISLQNDIDIELDNEKNESNNANISGENIFIQYNEKDKLNIDDILQKIPTCSYNDLKNIAKKFSLPVTQKIGNRSIVYKKTELCEILRDHIMELQKHMN